MKEFSLHLCGAGLITPLGDCPASVLRAVRAGKKAAVSEIATTGEKQSFPVMRVPDGLCADVSRLPRLRRASPISHFAMAAAFLCLRDAGLEPDALAGADTALIFAASDGSVEYTRRFFEGVEQNGPSQGSPLHFPETVYNAPASHVAAALGLTGHALSIVGDSAVALEACVVAGQLLASGAVRRVLVVAAEELDAIAVAGYASWGIAARSADGPGVIFGEGAGALLFEAGDPVQHADSPGCSLTISPGKSFCSPLQAARRLGELLSKATGNLNRPEDNSSRPMLTQDRKSDGSQPGIVVGSHGGGASGRLESFLLAKMLPEAQILYPRQFLGDGLTAASLWQIILAREILTSATGEKQGDALIPVTGHNGQLGVAALRHFAC